MTSVPRRTPRLRALFLLLGAGLASTFAAACAPAEDDEPVADAAQQLTANDALRHRWARFVRASVQPRLVARGMRDDLVKRATWFAVSEGIYTVATNPEYGQPGGRQNPITYSNCGDALVVNQRTALPDCFGALGFLFRSGNWQVGVAGVQVSDVLGRLPRLYRELYGELPERDLARGLLAMMGEDPESFPATRVEDLVAGLPAQGPKARLTAEQARRVRWASVLMRDPALNVALMLDNGWIKDGRAFPFGKAFVDTAWRDASETLTRLDRNGFRVDGPLAAAWASGQGSFACWKTYDELCLATYGLPIGPAQARAGAGPRVVQAFERAHLELHGEGGAVRVEGALLGKRARGGRFEPGATVDGRFSSYVLRYGGTPVFGLPLAAAAKIGGTWTQDFERVRLEENPGFDPNTSDPVWEVQRARLGAELPVER